jgi:hypothetical protein
MKEFKIGQFVNVIQPDNCYDCYSVMANIMNLDNWQRGKSPDVSKIYFVKCIEIHPDTREMLYAIENEGESYIVGENAIEPTYNEMKHDNCHIRFESNVCIVSSINYERIDFNEINLELGQYEGEVVFDTLCCNGMESNRFLIVNRKNGVLDFNNMKCQGGYHVVDKLQREFYLKNPSYISNSVLSNNSQFEYLHSIIDLGELEVAFNKHKLYYAIHDESNMSDFKVLTWLPSPVLFDGQVGVIFTLAKGWTIVYDNDFDEFYRG